jgi:alpha-glucosidase
MVWDAEAKNADFSSADKTWLPVKAPQAARAVSGQEAANDSVLNAYRSALAFRKSTPALSLGDTTFPKVADPILAVERRHDDTVITALYNFSNAEVSLTIEADTSLTGPANATKNGGTLSLPPYGYAFVESDQSLTLA